MKTLFNVICLITGMFMGNGFASAGPCIFIGANAAMSAKRADKTFLGSALTDSTMTPDRKGCFRHYEGGSVYWHIDGSVAEVHGGIRRMWASQGWEGSYLGFPQTDETVTPDGVGRFNHFQRGSIYWKPNLGPHMVINGFRSYWAARGWERNPALGYPINSEMPSFPELDDRYQDFEDGVLYYKHATGAIDELWPFPLASRTKEDLQNAITDTVDELLTGAGGNAYREDGVTISGTEDYSTIPSGGVLNRLLVVNVRVKYKAEFLGIDDVLPDPYSDLVLQIRVDGRRSFSGAAPIYSVINHWSASTTVPYPTRVVISPETINSKLREVLDPLVGKESILAELPHPLTLLSVKISREGSLSVFIAPID